MDDAVSRIDASFDRFEERLSAEFGELRRELSTRHRRIARFGWALVGILLVQLIAAVVALA